MVVGQGHRLNAALCQDLPIGGQAPETVLLLRRNVVIRQSTFQVDKGEVILGEQIPDIGEGIGIVVAYHGREVAALVPAGILRAQSAVPGKAQQEGAVLPLGGLVHGNTALRVRLGGEKLGLLRGGLGLEGLGHWSAAAAGQETGGQQGRAQQQEGNGQKTDAQPSALQAFSTPPG